MLLKTNLLLTRHIQYRDNTLLSLPRKRHIMTEFRKECEYYCWPGGVQHSNSRHAIKVAAMPPVLFQIHGHKPPGKQHFNLQKNFSWVVNVIVIFE